MELLDRNRRGIWRLSDCSGTRTDSHLIREQILNHLAKWWCSVYLQTKWLCVQVPLQSLVFILLLIYLFIGKKLHDQMRRPAFAALIIHVKLTIVNFVKRSMNLKIICLRGWSSDIGSLYFFRPSVVWSILRFSGGEFRIKLKET